MKYIESLQDGMHVSGVYLCKTKTIALTKNGKEYGSLTLQDKTGQLEAKIWDLNSPAIRDFEAMDYVQVDGSVTVFNNANQLDYFPVSEKDIDGMKASMLELIRSVNDPYLQKLLASFFEDPVFVKRFSRHSAARSVHHGFIGGLLEHSLSVATICDDISRHYTFVNRDLLVTGAILHDIGKLSELSAFPYNEYTDEGQLLGHIMIGAQIVSERIRKIEGFPRKLSAELIHMILSHHGELEYGSPKKPAIVEAMILSFVDNMDAKVETMYEAFKSKAPQNADGWLGFNKLLDSNIRRTSESGK